MSRTTRWPATTRMLYPSLRSLWRSGLRPVGRDDIEHHPLLHVDRLALDEGALLLLVLALAVGHGELHVGPGGRVAIVGQGDDLGERDVLLAPGLRAAVDDEVDGLQVLRLRVGVVHVDDLSRTNQAVPGALSDLKYSICTRVYLKSAADGGPNGVRRLDTQTW